MFVFGQTHTNACSKKRYKRPFNRQRKILLFMFNQLKKRKTQDGPLEILSNGKYSLKTSIVRYFYYEMNMIQRKKAEHLTRHTEKSE